MTPVSFWHDIPQPIIGLSPMDGVTDAADRPGRTDAVDDIAHPSYYSSAQIADNSFPHGSRVTLT